MRKLIITFSILLILSNNLLAQRVTRALIIPIPDTLIHNSLYNKITCIDSRSDTTNFGIVHWGFSNRKARVVANTPLNIQLANLLKKVNDTAAKDGKLLLNIRYYGITEAPVLFTEHGYCMLRAELYAQKEDRYKVIELLDTIWENSAIDVTKDLLKNSGDLLTHFIIDNLSYEPTDTNSYSLQEVLNVDSIEKSKIPAYTTTKYKDGLYLSYESFKMQQPDNQIYYSKRKDGSYKILNKINADGTQSRIKGSQSYAMIINGELFIGTDYGFDPMSKVNNEFVFTGRVKTSINSGQAFMASYLFGIIGGLIAVEAGSNKNYLIKIDHKTGGFMNIKEIK
ncbi:MAG: hypothetical protein WCP65_00665 [Bacteroidota bacterium]